MTRGPRAGPPPAAEDAATRVTLTYALGNLGGKQKSWMTSGNPALTALSRTPHPPQKRGRPPKYLPLEQGPEQQAQEAQPVRGQLPSNSTSPQLANVLSPSTSAQTLPSPTTVLPSPSPSEGTTADCVLPHASGAHDHGPQHEERFLEGARAAAAATKRPAEGELALLNKRMRPSVAAQDRPVPPPLRVQSAHQDMARRASAGQMSPTLRQPTHSQSPLESPHQQPQIPPRVPSQPHTKAQNSPTHPLATHNHSPYQSPHQMPAVPSHQHVLSQPHVQVQSGATPPMVQDPRRMSSAPTANPQNSAVPAPSSGTADWHDSCLKELHQLTTSKRIDPRLSDGKRIKALHLAVQDRDWDYLMTHLFYCLLTLKKTALPDGVSNSPHAATTVRFLSEVLDANDHLTPAVKSFFVRFPLPFQQMAVQNIQQYQSDLINFTNLMVRAPNYYALKTKCDERNFPPLMHELVYDLGIVSKQLQRIVFTAVTRRLWSSWGYGNRNVSNLVRRFEDEATQHFTTMQQQFYMLQVSHPNHDVYQSRQLEFKHWEVALKRLRTKYSTNTQQVLHNMPRSSTAATQFQHNPANASHPQYPMPMLLAYNNQLQPGQQLFYPASGAVFHSAQAAIQEGQGQPRGQPRLAPNQPLPHSQNLQPRSISAAVVPIFPAHGYRQPQQHQPHPARFGLHQAHLRDPLLQSESKERLYQYVKSFIREPRRLVDAGHKVEKWSFGLTREELERLPKNVQGIMGSPPIRNVDKDSLVLRLRCAKWPTAAKLPNQHTWATRDTSWIPNAFLTLNGKNLEQRKKLYSGKDLPIDLTSLVKEGGNTLEIAIMRTPTDERYTNYLVAIEVLGFTRHDMLLKDIQANNRIPAEETKKRIREKLSGTPDDDEIAVVDSNLQITLFDPFIGSKICDTPARGKACEHIDCFDLVTYIETRKRVGDASCPDHWKCPICNGDVRPHDLVIDGFLEEVRGELEKQGLLDTRAIIMEQDGSWKPKPEVLDGVADPGSPEEAGPPLGRAKVPAGVEVIDLGDSDDE